MIDKYLQIETRGLVFIGDFNPSIFHPYWLASKDLIQEEEAKNAKIEIVMNELSRFQLGEWLNIEVSRNRCDFKTMKKPYFYPMFDLAINIYKILGETPIKAVGINNVYDLSLKDAESYYKFGDVLAPLSNWDTALTSPKLLNIEIIESRESGSPFFKRVRLSPSEPELKVNFGINFNINNHFNLESGGNGYKASQLVEEKFDACAESSKEIVFNILSKVFK